MTSLRDLERHLRDQGCSVVREGGRHTIWRNAPGDRRTSVPRHREIPPTTARANCRQLDVPEVGQR